MIRPLVLLLALAPLAAEAETFTRTWVPKTEQATTALGRAFGQQAQRNAAAVSQAGQGNEATLSQSGTGNEALVIQRGRDNSATVTQSGGDNSAVLIQVGRGATADVTQSGSEAGVTFQVGRPDRSGSPEAP